MADIISELWSNSLAWNWCNRLVISSQIWHKTKPLKSTELYWFKRVINELWIKPKSLCRTMDTIKYSHNKIVSEIRILFLSQEVVVPCSKERGTAVPVTGFYHRSFIRNRALLYTEPCMSASHLCLMSSLWWHFQVRCLTEVGPQAEEFTRWVGK